MTTIDITKLPHQRADELLQIQQNGMDFMEFSEREEELGQFNVDDALAEFLS